MKQARYWILTIPYNEFVPYQPSGVTYIAGQLECGESTGYKHWQLVVYFRNRVRLSTVKELFGQSCHAEPTRSSYSRNYVFKDETGISGTRFELGHIPRQRGNDKDWEAILESAKKQRFEEIPGDVLVRYYNNIKRISMDNLEPVAEVRTTTVYWGPTGTGKSRRAWEEAGMDAYPKDPRSKFWDGYQGQKHVVMDEFRGDIDITHMLRWLDRYPVIVEVKGSSTVLKANRIWITSNLRPEKWYKDIDEITVAALMRRLEVIYLGVL